MRILISTSSPMYFEPNYPFDSNKTWLQRALEECKNSEVQKTLNLGSEILKFSKTKDYKDIVLNLVFQEKENILTFYLRYETLKFKFFPVLVFLVSTVYSKINIATKVYLELCKEKPVCSSNFQTKEGMNFWKSLILKAKEKGYFVYILDSTLGFFKYEDTLVWSKEHISKNLRLIISKDKIENILSKS